MSSYQATREAARALFFQDMGEATSDAGRERVIMSMVEVAHQAECTRVMQRVVDSLLDIYQCYQKIALQAAEVNEHLRTLRVDSITNAAQIGVLKNVQSTAKQYLAARKVHDIAFKAALRNPAHSDPLVLEESVATDAKAYMIMTTEWSSKTFMAMKSAPNMSVAMGKVLEDQIQGVKKSNPGLAERMSK